MIVNKSLTSLYRFESYNIRSGCLAKWLKQQFVKLFINYSGLYFLHLILFYGVVISTQDFGSCSNGLNPFRTTITNASSVFKY